MKLYLTILDSVEALDNAIISDPFPLITVGFRLISSKQAIIRNLEAPAATGSRTQGFPAFTANSAATFIAGNQAGESVPTLIQRASALGVKSGNSSMEWSMAGEAPADKRVLAIKSIETKLVMHWMSGDRVRTASRMAHALAPHCRRSSSSSFCFEFIVRWYSLSFFLYAYYSIIGIVAFLNFNISIKASKTTLNFRKLPKRTINLILKFYIKI